MFCILISYMTLIKIHKKNYCGVDRKNSWYEGWNFNSGNYLFTTDTK